MCTYCINDAICITVHVYIYLFIYLYATSGTCSRHCMGKEHAAHGVQWQVTGGLHLRHDLNLISCQMDNILY